MSSNQDYICCFGEVLWDLLPTGKLPGGAPMNVATHLQNLGLPAAMISSVGQDALGQELKDFLISKNCNTAYIQQHATLGTGIVKVTLSENLDASYDIVQPIAWDFIDLTNETTNLVSQAKALVFGTLVCRNSHSYHTLLQLLAVSNLKIYDVNLRSPHYSQAIIESLLQQADIVKMNDDELEIIASWYGIIDKSEETKIQELVQKFSLKTLIVTQGSNGAMLWHEEKIYQSSGFKVKVVDTIGSGDSFLAGFLKNYLAGQSPEYCLKYACAIGAVVASHQGANPSISEKDILQMMNL